MFGLGSDSKAAALKSEALDALDSSVMLADPELNILYVNPSLLAFLREAEADVQRELPEFSVANLVGRNIDLFHKTPSHQRNMLGKMAQPHKATISVGGRKFDLRIAPLGQGGKRRGFVVEWHDAQTRLTNLDYAAQIASISRSQATIEFTPEGKILTANENFLKSLGYTLEEVRGQHHSLFVEPTFRQSADYGEFWRRLAGGEFQAGEFKRIAKGGAEVWIQGAYNPIFNAEGRVAKVVKFAVDVTGRVGAVNLIANSLERLSAGDLTQNLVQPFIPELDRLRVDFNGSIKTLATAMSAIRRSVQAIRNGVSEINAAATDLSQRTERQAATLGQTATALNETTDTVKKSAEGAARARDVVSSTKKEADQSGDVVRMATQSMGKIEQSSKQIGQIIAVIDEIAFQTNLLALNAGVEAARAGEAGRGFAVVASEVRALAQRSAEAAKEIKTLISTSSSQVQEGVRQVNEAGEALGRIVTQVTQITSAVNGIAEAAQKQAVGLQEVNTAVGEMDQVTQQNAAMVEETSAATRSLSSETEELAHLIEHFKTPGGEERAVSGGPRGSSARSYAAEPPVRRVA